MNSQKLSALDEKTVTDADTQLYGGIYYSPGEFPGYIHGAGCSSGTCRYGTGGEPDLERRFFDLEYQAVMKHEGMRFGQARKRITDTENPFDLTGYGACHEEVAAPSIRIGCRLVRRFAPGPPMRDATSAGAKARATSFFAPPEAPCTPRVAPSIEWRTAAQGQRCCSRATPRAGGAAS